MTNSAKNLLRRQFLQHRQALSPALWREQSDRICTHLQNWEQFERSQTILAYQSHRQEPDLSYLFDRVDKQWGLPRCVDRDLLWHRWQPLEPLLSGKYSILEPNSNSPLLEPANVDLMLVPTVGIDRHGYRLGYGGGYYDRLRANRSWRQIKTIGISFDLSYVDMLPIDPWDIRLDAICTESGIFEVATHSRF
jgi:5-formyltetrahydrofolate cyclo-ligase